MNIQSRIIEAVVFSGLIAWLGFCAARDQFPLFIGAYALAFLLYAAALRRPFTDEAARWYVGLGLFLRVVLLFAPALLSDDIYRFLWDGRLSAQGVHPFAHPPEWFMQPGAPALRGIDKALFERLNSPLYHSVYPPVCQVLFWAAAKIAPENIPAGIFAVKGGLLAFEYGSLQIWLRMRKMRPENPVFDKAAAAWALNPLVLLEVMGNAHFEGAMLFFMSAGLYLLYKNRIEGAAACWALAVASKLSPLLFLPLLWAWLGWRKGMRFMLAFALVGVACFLPLADPEILKGMASSLRLYFRQFEFNASVYYLLKYAGQRLADQSVDVGRALGPALGLVTALFAFAGAAYTAFRKKENSYKPGLPPCPPSGRGGACFRRGLSLEMIKNAQIRKALFRFFSPSLLRIKTPPLPEGGQGGSNIKPPGFQGGSNIKPPDSHENAFAILHVVMLLTASVYLFNAAAAHPWYALVPLSLGLWAGYTYPIVWSAVAALSYSHYAGGGFQENYLLIALEYLVLWTYAAWEIRARRHSML